MITSQFLSGQINWKAGILVPGLLLCGVASASADRLEKHFKVEAEPGRHHSQSERHHHRERLDQARSHGRRQSRQRRKWTSKSSNPAIASIS